MQFWTDERPRENCIVTVHLGVARGRYAALIDAELFLPESWDADRERCREADVPDGMGHRAKWRIAFGQVLNARLAGFALDWLTFDEGYGSKPGFLDGLGLLGLSYVGEVPRSFSCFTREPAAGEGGSRADDLARHSPVFHGQAWQEVTLPRQTLGPQTWQARMAPAWVRHSDGVGVARRWLMVARHGPTGEEKYFICGGVEAGLETRMRVGFTRHNVEHGFRLAKTELGFGHYEGRSYVGLMRHMTLCLVTLGFVAGQAAGLRGGKSGGDGGAGVPCAEPRVPDLGAGAWRGGGAGGPRGGDDPVPPAAEPGRTRITPAPWRGVAAGASTRPKTQTAETTASRTPVAL
ncbi:MAG: transposase [Gemmataceae bacterium]|nr:transposase [Gemmataceae bacterium]